MGDEMKKVALIHGPNLNFLGIRDPEVYGTDTYQQINQEILEEASKYQLELDIYQSNHEGDLIDYIQTCYHNQVEGIIMNAGAYTHYSYGIRDAIASVSIPTIEVHLSNINNREKFREKSVIAPVCIGQICGFGKFSYIIGIHALANYLEKTNRSK